MDKQEDVVAERRMSFFSKMGGLRWLLVLWLLPGISPLYAQAPKLMTAAELVALDQPEPGLKIEYGQDPLQFGYLKLPDGPGPHHVAVLLHGGCWLAQFDVDHIGLLAEALAQEGIATWSLEYRRVGNDGGGWPGTFMDVAQGTDFVRTLAEEYPLDTSRVIAVGHSAGGQLALWLACRHRLPKTAELFMENPLKLQGILALAAVPQLEEAHAAKVCGQVVDKLMGGSPEAVPKRYAEVAPAHMLPLGVRQVQINGAHDSMWSRYGEEYFEKAKAAGDDICFIVAPEAGHFELILPCSSTWPIVRDAALSMWDTEN